MDKNEKNRLKEIQKALNLFPKVVKEKVSRYKERQRFLKKTFGPLVRQLEKDLKKSK